MGLFDYQRRRAIRKRKKMVKSKDRYKKRSGLRYFLWYIGNTPWWILYKLFDVGFVYIVGTTSDSRKYKVGLSWIPQIRINMIDRSIGGSIEFIEYKARVWGMRKIEKQLHEHPEFSSNRFVYRGSGKTEWSRISKSTKDELKTTLKLISSIHRFKLLCYIITVIMLISIYRLGFDGFVKMWYQTINGNF